MYRANVFLFLFVFLELALPKKNMNQVAISANETTPPEVGSPLPELRYKTIDGINFNLNEIVKDKPVILIYYRGEWN